MKKYLPWLDRHARFQPLKAVVFAACLAPGALHAYWWAAGELGGRAVNELIHGSGLWAMRFLVISLAVTPLNRSLDWSRLLTVRRMLGVTAGAYAIIHFLLYVVEQKFAPVVVITEIIKRFYLTIGFVALAGLVALTATSTDKSVRKLGRAWKRLHWLVYPIGGLALWHYALQSKANVSDAVFLSGLFTWLILWRALPDGWRRPVVTYPALAACATVLTAGIEASWYGLVSGVDPWRVLAANQSIEFGFRPAHWVLITTVGITAIIAVRRWMTPRTGRAINAGRSSGPIRAGTANGS